LSDNVITLGNYCFADCGNLISIKNITNVKSLGYFCFGNCTSLTSIPDFTNVTSLSDSCFENCTNLISIKISKSITSLGDYCFANCTDLTSIQFNDSQNIDLVGPQCFTGIGSSPVVKYYNAKDFDELPDSLKNTQKKFKSATFIYYPCPYV